MWFVRAFEGEAVAARLRGWVTHGAREPAATGLTILASGCERVAATSHGTAPTVPFACRLNVSVPVMVTATSELGEPRSASA